MQEQLDSQFVKIAEPLLPIRPTATARRPTSACPSERHSVTPGRTGLTTLTTPLGTDRSTALEDSQPGGPKKSKIRRALWRGRTIPVPRTSAHTALNREYLRALRAAEMAVWDAADRATTPVLQPRQPTASAATLDRTLASPECAAWIAGALAALIVGASLLIRVTDGVLQLASLVQHFVS